MKIKIRRVKIGDLPSLVEKFHKFCNILKTKGARDIALDDAVLRGGIVIEIGAGFTHQNWMCVVAEADGEVVAFMVAVLESCPPISEYNRCVRIHANYSDEDSLAGPRVLMSMWKMVDEWAKERGVDFYYANIHPGNQPSVRAAKAIGFKHHYTQFFKLVGSEGEEV